MLQFMYLKIKKHDTSTHKKDFLISRICPIRANIYQENISTWVLMPRLHLAYDQLEIIARCHFFILVWSPQGDPTILRLPTISTCFFINHKTAARSLGVRAPYEDPAMIVQLPHDFYMIIWRQNIVYGDRRETASDQSEIVGTPNRHRSGTVRFPLKVCGYPTISLRFQNVDESQSKKVYHARMNFKHNTNDV